MGEEKKEGSIEQLEKKIDSLEAKFDDFITNHFSHLFSNVTTLINQNKATQRKLGTLEKNILIILKNTTIDLRK